MRASLLWLDVSLISGLSRLYKSCEWTTSLNGYYHRQTTFYRRKIYASPPTLLPSTLVPGSEPYTWLQRCWNQAQVCLMSRNVCIRPFNVKVSPILAIQIDFAGHLCEQVLLATVLSRDGPRGTGPRLEVLDWRGMGEGGSRRVLIPAVSVPELIWGLTNQTRDTVA